MSIQPGFKRAAVWLLTLGAGAAPALADTAGVPAAAGGGMTHRMMMLIMQLGAILFAAKIGNMLFEKLKLPGVLGELCAGLIIGPYLLGGLPLPGLLPDGLFPMHDRFPVSPELYGICSLAAIILLFMTGLETDIKLFLRYSIAGSLVGIGGVAASFLLGNLTGVFFSPSFGRQLGFLFAACSWASSPPPLPWASPARVLAEQRKLDSPEGVTILAGAVIDDVLGIILAIGLGVIGGLRTMRRHQLAAYRPDRRQGHRHLAGRNGDRPARGAPESSFLPKNNPRTPLRHRQRRWAWPSCWPGCLRKRAWP